MRTAREGWVTSSDREVILFETNQASHSQARLHTDKANIIGAFLIMSLTASSTNLDSFEGMATKLKQLVQGHEQKHGGADGVQTRSAEHSSDSLVPPPAHGSVREH